MDAFEALDLRSSSSNKDATTKILDSAQEIAEVDHGKEASITERDDHANEE
jgi:hypothetical protein